MTSAAAVEPLPYNRREAEAAIGDDWENIVRSAFRWMILGRTLDARMQALQRQGRVGFYGAATGQEAVNVAAGMASSPADWVFPGLREQLVALVRGHALETYVHHLFADARDPALGRNMPCHPTAREVHYVSMSSVIGTQISQAAGLALGLKRRGEPAAAMAFFGDGATSSNDFHAGMNFAGVLRLPVLFCCTNNQWAISVPVSRQTASSSLAAKSSAYGFSGERVDGTDFLGVYRTLTESLHRIRSGGGPELVEFVVYRMTPHSSSDDPGRYQPAEWMRAAAQHDPFERLSSWLDTHRLVSVEERAAWTTEAEHSVRGAIEEAERTPAPPDSSVSEGVYAVPSVASGLKGG